MKIIKKIIILLFIAILFYGGYVIWEDYSNQSGLEEGKSADVPVKQIEKEKGNAGEIDEQNRALSEGERDNRRKLDLVEIGQAIDEYAEFNKGEYPVTAGYEKISDKNNALNQMLKMGGYLKKDYTDPLSETSYYGYRSDGKSYELTAALEDKNDISCASMGDYCIYSLRACLKSSYLAKNS